MNVKPLAEWSIQELKAAAFDELSKLETCRTNVRLLQSEIANREQVEGNNPAPVSTDSEPKKS